MYDEQLESLVSQSLKNKYFRHGTIMEAKVRYKPSYIWRSLLAARDLAKEGMYWRIGSGNQVKIWKDKWIPTPTSYLV